MKKLLFLALSLFLVACGGSSTDSIGIPEATGGAEDCLGGAPGATGGSTAEAGSNTGGEAVATGGAPSTGGVVATGGKACESTKYEWDSWYMRGDPIPSDHLFQVVVSARYLFPVSAFCLVDPVTDEITDTCYDTSFDPETCANTCVGSLRHPNGDIATFCGKDLQDGIMVDFGIGRIASSPGAVYTATSKQCTKREFSTFLLDVGASDTCK